MSGTGTPPAVEPKRVLGAVGIPGVVGIEIDKAAFKADVLALLDTSVVYKEVADVLTDVKTGNFFALVRDIPEAVAAVASAIEIVKNQYIVNDGSGAKFDKALAVSTGAQILDNLVKFTGVAGLFIEKFDGAVFKIALSVFVNGKPKDWLSVASSILAGGGGK